jgi:hypothetical protein
VRAEEWLVVSYLTLWLASYLRSTDLEVMLEVLSAAAGDINGRGRCGGACEERGGWVGWVGAISAWDTSRGASCGVTASTIQPSTKEGTSVHPENHTKEARATKDVICDGEFSIEVLYLIHCPTYRLRQGAHSFAIFSASTRGQPVLSRWLQTLSSKC